MESIYLVVAFSLAVSILVRFASCSLSFGWFSRGFAGDSSVHLQIVKQLKKGWKERAVENYVIPNKMTYPVLFHRFCALFPIHFLERYSSLAADIHPERTPETQTIPYSAKKLPA